jgi:hypothetical protein
MNQQRCPALNSHAGQFRRILTGHFCIDQQGTLPLPLELFRNRRKSSCRSTCVGIFLHPCSKLCMALGEIPSNWASWAWVLPRWRRIRENSVLSMENLDGYNYTTMWQSILT